jgi:hypothetical protein
MTVIAKTTPSPYATNQASDTSVNSSVQQAKTGSGTLFMVEIDNTANSAVTYVKVYDNTTVTVGTTVPDWIFYAPASVKRTYSVPTGLAFSTGLAYAAVTQGGTAGTTSPSSAVLLKLVFD